MTHKGACMPCVGTGLCAYSNLMGNDGAKGEAEKDEWPELRPACIITQCGCFVGPRSRVFGNELALYTCTFSRTMHPTSRISSVRSATAISLAS